MHNFFQIVGGCGIPERGLFPHLLRSGKYKLEKETEMKRDRVKTSLVLLLRLLLIQNVALNFKLHLTSFSRCRQIKSPSDALVRR